jgi:hypothetical protein
MGLDLIAYLAQTMCLLPLLIVGGGVILYVLFLYMSIRDSVYSGRYKSESEGWKHIWSLHNKDDE